MKIQSIKRVYEGGEIEVLKIPTESTLIDVDMHNSANFLCQCDSCQDHSYNFPIYREFYFFYKTDTNADLDQVKEVKVLLVTDENQEISDEYKLLKIIAVNYERSKGKFVYIYYKDL